MNLPPNGEKDPSSQHDGTDHMRPTTTLRREPANGPKIQPRDDGSVSYHFPPSGYHGNGQLDPLVA